MSNVRAGMVGALRPLAGLLLGAALCIGHAQAQTGPEWLATVQSPDGSYGGAAGSLATPAQSTAEVLRAQVALGQTSSPGFEPARAWLETHLDVDAEFLARMLIVASQTGRSDAAALAALLASQGPDGGFGARPGYGSSVLDTAYAAEALAWARGAGTPQGAQAVAFLLAAQQRDGGWSDGPNDPSVFLTATVVRALTPYASTFQGVAGALTAAQAFLLAARGADALWGEDFQSALALVALVPVVADLSLVDASAAALRQRQLADGSWADDAFTTALALQAGQQHAARQSGGTSAPRGSVAGFVVRAGSTEPIAGAEIRLAQAPGMAVLTTGDGYFVIPGLAPGAYTVTATKPGHTAASAAVQVLAGQVALAGKLVLDLVPTTGLVSGKVFAAATQQPLAGVQVSLAGATPRSVLSDATGAFDFGAVEPGPVTLRLEKPGYLTLTGAAAVEAGRALSLQVGMTPAGGFVDDSPGEIGGRVLDARTGEPIAGAQVDLGGALAATSAADGAFRIPGVPRATYQGAVGAAGYQARRFTVVFPAGASGDLGTLALFPVDPAEAPTSLTLRGLVADGLSGAPVAGATVSIVETGARTSADGNGRFVLTGIPVKSLTAAVEASGYAATSYALQVAAFGEAEVVLKLAPPGAGGTASTLSGVATDAVRGTPIAGARVAVAGTSLSAVTGADGRYTLSGVDQLEFTLDVSAVGYVEQSLGARLATHGAYAMDAALQPVAAQGFQVVSVAARRTDVGANDAVTFGVRVASLLAASQSALLVGEIQDASGTPVAKVLPYADGTSTPEAEFAFAAGEVKDLTVSWRTAQFSPGTYRLVLRVVEPGTITRAVPLGRVLAEGSGTAQVIATRAIAGALALAPPLTQAGVSTPVALGALLQNAGNVALPGGEFELTITSPTTQATLLVASAVGPALEVGASAELAFGSWVPTDAGNLRVTVRRKAGDAGGALEGTLYVGDKASGAFSVDRVVVPEGTQTVRGSIEMQGVDVTRGHSQDPLFALVKTAVTKGAAYVAPTALAWDRSSRCNGCHIQSQSLLGLSSAQDKATVDAAATRYLFNNAMSGQFATGALGPYNPHAYYQTTRTLLNAWSLGAWAEPARTFRTRYKAAQFMLARRQTSGVVSYWSPDHASGWWNTTESHTALAVKAFADLLRDAERGVAAGLRDDTLQAGVALGSGTIQGMTRGPDGALYVATSAGQVRRLDLATGAVTVAASGLPASIQGVAFAADGTLWVTSTVNPTVTRIAPDGTRAAFSVGGYLVDAVLGPDGWLYAADYNGNRVLRVSPAGVAETYVSGGRLSGPSGLAFDEAGNLFVANQNGYAVLRVASDRTVSVFADGLSVRPVRMARTDDGVLYVTTTYSEANGGALRVLADGTVERVVERAGVLGVVAAGADVYFANTSTRTLHRLEQTALATTGLDALRAEIPRGARYLLAGSGDNSSDNTVHALRLIGLAEARGLVTDAALGAQIDRAIATITALLRSRQRADGGWARYTYYPSDPLSTAMVGIALEYTNPSPSDPQIRATIQYLLRSQRADGSWDNVYSGLSTRLASTSYVMVFMPKALERLGGIDVGLHVRLDRNVALANPTQAPTQVTANADGTTDLVWQMQGVTSAGRRVDFDLTLADMGLHEERPVARAAHLEFANSFVDGLVQLPLVVPTVRAESELRLALGLDRTVYQANEPVLIAAEVANLGPTTASGEVELAVRPAGATEAIAVLPRIPVVDLASQARAALSAQWTTGSTLAGAYEVLGRLIDGRGRVLSQAVVPFRIIAPAAVAATSVATDRPVYQAFDVVNLAAQVRNASVNALLAPSRLELVVRTPAGAPLFTAARDVLQLVPGAVATLPFTLALADAAAGQYPVTVELRDAFTRELLSTSATSFQVERRPLVSLAGSASVQSATVYLGDVNVCSDAAWNVAGETVAGVRLVHQLVSVTSGAILSEVGETVDLPGGRQAHALDRSVATAGLELGGYACVLYAELGGERRALASAGFQVVEPPIRVGATLRQAGHGRLLVLLDPAKKHGGCDRDEERHAHAADGRRAFLEELLVRDGWSYTITESTEAFEHELRSGGYTVYALLAERRELEDHLRAELREAVFRGEGLLVAGAHHDLDDGLRAVLGVEVEGDVDAADGVVLSASSFPLLSGAFDLRREERPRRLELHGAESLAHYRLARRGHHDDRFTGDGAGPAAPGCTKPDPRLDAIALNAYGQGQAAVAGFDLLGAALRDGQDGVAATMLRNLLGLVHPLSLPAEQGAVVPVELAIANQGVPASVRAAVTLPPGARVVDPGQATAAPDGQSLVFELPMASGQEAAQRFWIRLPAAAGSATVSAEVRATAGAASKTVRATLELAVAPQPSLPDLRAALDALVRAGKSRCSELKEARHLLDRAIAARERREAREAVLKAAGHLASSTDERVIAVHLGLARWLRWAALGPR